MASDLREGKLTLPYIRTISVANPKDRKNLEEILSSPEPDESLIDKGVDIVRRYDGVSYSREVARAYGLAAQQAIDAIPASAIKDNLKSVIQFIVNRES